jgi:hypothetical protein
MHLLAFDRPRTAMQILGRLHDHDSTRQETEEERRGEVEGMFLGSNSEVRLSQR